MKYILGAVGLLVGFLGSYVYFQGVEPNCTMEVIFNDFGLAILVITLICGLILMGIGSLLTKKK
jgi:hypothetical protein